MDSKPLPNHIVYSTPVIEFVTVVAESCLLLEHASSYTRSDFVIRSIKFFSLLYSKAIVLTPPDPVFDDTVERFVSESDYQYVKEQIEHMLGVDDTYLEVFHPDMALSDTPVAAFISEDLADVYQEIKDFAANYQTLEPDIMNDALVACLESFGLHWGQKNLNALRALHALRFSDNFENDAEIASKAIQSNKNTILNFLKDDEDISTNFR